MVSARRLLVGTHDMYVFVRYLRGPTFFLGVLSRLDRIGRGLETTGEALVARPPDARHSVLGEEEGHSKIGGLKHNIIFTKKVRKK